MRSSAPTRPPRSSREDEFLRLTLDLGNGSLKLRLWKGSRPLEAWRWTEGALPEIPRPDRVLGVRVPGRETPKLAADWPDPLWVGETLEPPGRVLYEDPAELGLDRRLVAWEAGQRWGPSLVLDGGTATTLSYGDREGRILGLWITVGAGLLSRSLASAAPALAPYIEEMPPASVGGLPVGTRDNLSFGLQRGWEHLIEGLLAGARARLASELDLVSPTLIATGSDGERLLGLLGEGGILVPDLIHRALLRLDGLDPWAG